MKKGYLLTLAFILCGLSIKAQTVISQSIDPATVDTSGAVCWNDQTGFYPQNSFFRSYDLAGDFGITGDFSLSAVQFGQGAAIDGTVVTINISYTDVGGFPGGTLTQVATVNHTLASADDGSLIEVPVTVTIPAGKETVFELLVPESNSLRYFPGYNTAGQNAPCYIQSEPCNMTSPTNTAGVTDDEYLMNLVGTTMSTANQNFSKIFLFPNPVVDVLYITTPIFVEPESATLFDLLGKQIQIVIKNNSIDLSKVPSGVYILKLETNQGPLTKKIIKE